MNTDTITDINPLRGGPLFGFWYPALPSGKLRPGTLQPLLMLGLPILFCRDRQGKVAAMRDLCPHRGMPLSFGRFDGERVGCAFHGWQFDMAGRCRHISALVGEGTALQSEKLASHPILARNETTIIGSIFLMEKEHRAPYRKCRSFLFFQSPIRSLICPSPIGAASTKG